MADKISYIFDGNAEMNPYRKILYFLPAGVYCALIFLLSARTIKIRLGIIYWDKAAHLLEFMVLGLLLAFGFFNFSPGKNFLSYYLAVMTGSLVGLLDELHQLFVPGRQCDWRDWVADIFGVIVGLVIFWLISTKSSFLSSNNQKGNTL
jgi:VanZ family protein